jgi:hypothetical protein
MPRTKKQKIKYSFNYTPTSFWKKWLETYIVDLREDLPRIFELLFHQCIRLLMRENVVKIPFLGAIRVVVIKAKKPRLYNDNPRFSYPISKLEFVPSKQMKDIFVDHKLTTYDLDQLNKGKLDWYRKSRNREKGIL